MKNQFLLIIFGIFGLQASLSAQSLVVDYLDGTVELQAKDHSWKAVEVGAKLSPESVLRISDAGLVELSQGALKVHIAKDGTYQLSKSLVQAKQKTDSKLMGLTGGQISMLLGKGNNGVAVANMGARGDAKGDDKDVTWAGDDSTGALDDIRGLMNKKDWSGALKATNKALATQTADAKTLLFDKALILSNMGLAAGSLKALQVADFQPTDTQYLASVLLVGSQGLETQDFDLVLSKTAEALQLKPETGICQNLKLAQALAWKGKGDTEKSKALLGDVVNLAPKSATGEEAAKLLNS